MSGRKRFFVENADSSEVVLSGDEFIHAKTVQHVEEGTEIILLDGSGNEYTAIVARVEKRSLTAHIVSTRVSDKEPKTYLYLLCGALKGDKTELVVQKATELGAAKIGVFCSEYCAAFMNANKIERLQKVAKEAAKQCLRATVPQVEYYEDFISALKSAKDCDNKIIASELAEKSDADLKILSGSCALVVGSEGGFSKEEIESAKAENFKEITLGKRILRAETAAIALLTLAAYSVGELK